MDVTSFKICGDNCGSPYNLEQCQESYRNSAKRPPRIDGVLTAGYGPIEEKATEIVNFLKKFDTGNGHQYKQETQSICQHIIARGLSQSNEELLPGCKIKAIKTFFDENKFLVYSTTAHQKGEEVYQAKFGELIVEIGAYYQKITDPKYHTKGGD